ncbi:MAG: hypothetical protein WAU70_05000 [Flavobacteriales bacterium]
MPVYRYNKQVTVAAGQNVVLTIEFPENSTGGTHDIDLLVGQDIEGYNEIEEDLGTQASFGKRLVIWTKAFDLDPGIKDVKVDFLINGKLVQRHTNAKAEDPSPQIKVTMNF